MKMLPNGAGRGGRKQKGDWKNNKQVRLHRDRLKRRIKKGCNGSGQAERGRRKKGECRAREGEAWAGKENERRRKERWPSRGRWPVTQVAWKFAYSPQTIAHFTDKYISSWNSLLSVWRSGGDGRGRMQIYAKQDSEPLHRFWYDGAMRGERAGDRERYTDRNCASGVKQRAIDDAWQGKLLEKRIASSSRI